MKITKRKLRNIIKEELLKEGYGTKSSDWLHAIVLLHIKYEMKSDRELEDLAQRAGWDDNTIQGAVETAGLIPMGGIPGYFGKGLNTDFLIQKGTLSQASDIDEVMAIYKDAKSAMSKAHRNKGKYFG